MSGLRPGFRPIFRFEEQESTLREEDAIVWQQVYRRFPAHGQTGREVIVATLDRAALEALQAASPVTFAHDVDGRPVVMLIPLNYQLEKLYV